MKRGDNLLFFFLLSECIYYDLLMYLSVGAPPFMLTHTRSLPKLHVLLMIIAVV